MATPIKKRKYYTGNIYFTIEGKLYWRNNGLQIFENEIVSYDGAKNLVIKRDGKTHDLSQYNLDGLTFHNPIGSVQSYNYRVAKHVNVLATIYGGLSRPNFRFKDHLKYSRRDTNGHYFESVLGTKTHYVTGKDFDAYFVPNMIKGGITGTFTYAKHGSTTWLTLVTD